MDALTENTVLVAKICSADRYTMICYWDLPDDRGFTFGKRWVQTFRLQRVQTVFCRRGSSLLKQLMNEKDSQLVCKLRLTVRDNKLSRFIEWTLGSSDRFTYSFVRKLLCSPALRNPLIISLVTLRVTTDSAGIAIDLASPGTGQPKFTRHIA